MAVVWLALAGPTVAEFTPPDAATRQRAIGTTREPAFASEPGFAPIPAPGPSDWLARNAEPGQTYDQFARDSHPPGRDRRTLYIQPLGPLHRSAQLEEFTRAFFCLPVTVREPLSLQGLPVTERQRQTGRQLLTGDLMRVLSQRLPADAYCQLGLTMVDIYPGQGWNFVFGQASIASHVGVFSLARYDPRFYGEARGDETLILTRSCKVLAHETCHMFGMEHCIYFACLMNGSNHLEETDASPLHLCPVCLRKLQHSVGFDPVVRYRALARCCRKLQLRTEAAWLERMLVALKGPHD